MNKKNIGIGRRKCSTAIVELISSPGIEDNSRFQVNGRGLEEYFQYNFTYLNKIQNPLQLVNVVDNYKIVINVSGGGLTGQADAIRLGLARALLSINTKDFRETLKRNGTLSRDARIKERRKYGLKKARKASQYSKR